MEKDNDQTCNESMDYINHVLNEQITKICVKEEEERVREELNNKEDI
ncbi:MAG: hypothetical protein ACQEWV_25985 [Bacillota bacterium]